MSGYDSPNFKKQAANPSVARRELKEFNVGFPEGVQQNIDQNQQLIDAQRFSQPGYDVSHTQQPAPRELQTAVREAKKEQIATANKISANAKQRIELLTDIGRLTKDVKIGDFIFSIRTLKSKEMREAAIAVFSQNITQLEAGYEARKQQLARSIYAVDGQAIELVLGTNDFEAKLFFVEELEEIVADRLWEELNSLKEDSKNKYGINSEKDAKEVSEDLKK